PFRDLAALDVVTEVVELTGAVRLLQHRHASHEARPLAEGDDARIADEPEIRSRGELIDPEVRRDGQDLPHLAPPMDAMLVELHLEGRVDPGRKVAALERQHHPCRVE